MRNYYYNYSAALFCQIREVDCATRSKVYNIIGKHAELATACGWDRNTIDNDDTNSLDIPADIHIYYICIYRLKKKKNR